MTSAGSWGGGSCKASIPEGAVFGGLCEAGADPVVGGKDVVVVAVAAVALDDEGVAGVIEAGDLGVVGFVEEDAVELADLAASLVDFDGEGRRGILSGASLAMAKTTTPQNPLMVNLSRWAPSFWRYMSISWLVRM